MSYRAGDATAKSSTGPRKIPTAPAVPLVRVAVGIVVTGEAGQERVLITRRHDDRPLGGLWELPGGKVEPDELPEAAVVRELVEEVGLTVRVVGSLPSIDHAYDHASVRLLPYWCEPVSGEARPLDVAELAWVEPAELKRRPFPPANGPMIDAIIDALAG